MAFNETAVEALKSLVTTEHVEMLERELALVDERARLEPGYLRNEATKIACRLSFSGLQEISIENPERFNLLLQFLKDFKDNALELVAIADKALARMNAADCRENIEKQ